MTRYLSGALAPAALTLGIRVHVFQFFFGVSDALSRDHNIELRTLEQKDR